MLLDGGSPAPLELIGGAVAGATAWVPVYPIDVVKTNTDGCSSSAAQHLYDDGGAVGPLVVNAVTFYVDLICAMPMLLMSGQRGAGRGMHGT